MDRGTILLQLDIFSETGGFLLGCCLPCCREYTGLISISPQPCFSKISSFLPLLPVEKTSCISQVQSTEVCSGVSHWCCILHLLRSHFQRSHQVREKILLKLPWAQHMGDSKGSRSRVDADGREELQAHYPSQFPMDQTLAAQTKLVLKTILWFVHSQVINDPKFYLQTFGSRAPRSLWWAQRVANAKN